MTLKLVVKSEASCGSEELLLSGSSHGVGRLHDNDLSIQIDCVSGYHAELKRTADGGYAISDLKSTNGTFLNGNRVTAPERVRSGDHLKFGSVLVAVEEKIEVLAWPQRESLHGDGPSKVVSLKDLFGFESGDHFNTYPITPIRPAGAMEPAMANGGDAPPQPVKMAPPVLTPAVAAQQAERVHQLERAQQLERAREAERLRQIEQAREAERARQIEQAREAERVRQLEQAREAERVRQIEQAREAERVRQLEQAREAERVRQIEQAREAERARQLEQAREAERARQIEAQEAERARQLEQAREAERVRQIEQAREAERARQIEQAREAARERQIERAAVAELAEVNVQRGAEPPGGVDYGSAIHSLSTQLESAMREISRLKASMPGESLGAVVRNGHGARPPQPGDAAVQGRDHHERDGQEGRALVHNPPPLTSWTSENERVFEDLGKLPTHSVVQAPERLGVARSIWRKICRR